MRRKTIDERLNEGGPFLWVACLLGAIGFYGLVWIMLALGVMLEL
jgi:hypothetical protein